jgi:hypothetical protein
MVKPQRIQPRSVMGDPLLYCILPKNLSEEQETLYQPPSMLDIVVIFINGLLTILMGVEGHHDR